MSGRLSGTEDLVSVLEDCDAWVRHFDTRNIDGLTWCIQRYRPRIERLFAHIEGWTRQSDGGVRWRSISRGSITTLYGNTAKSRIADPPASTQPNRYFMESLPPLEFEYSRADIDETGKEIDTESLGSLPYGLQGFQQAPAF
jgi:hypothetical protein